MINWQTRLHILRGITAWVVVAAHVVMWFRGHFWAELYTWTLRLFPGTACVYLFFVLSGYIITRVHAKDFSRPIALPSYCLRRVTRLFPAYWFFSLASLAVLWFGLYSWDDNMVRIPTIWDKFNSFFLLPSMGYDHIAGVSVGWSLFYEMLFYGFVGLAILHWPTGLFFAVLFLILSAWGLPGLDWHPILANKHVFLFVPGVAAALLLPKMKWPRWLCHAVWIAGAILFFATQIWLGHFRYFVIACGLIVTGVAALDLHYPPPQPTRLVRALIELGTISYSLYLCHTVVQALVFAVVGPPTSLWLWPLYAFAPLPVAWVSYRLLEKPSIDWATRTTRRWRSRYSQLDSHDRIQATPSP